MEKAIFLDRDGTLIENGEGYLYKKEHLEFLPGVIKGLKELSSEYLLFIITNQSGIGRGYYTENDFIIFQGALTEQLARHGIKITQTFHCPHRPDDGCECRKPNPFFILKARDTYDLDLDRSWMIGDSPSDLETAKQAGVSGVLVSNDQTAQEAYAVADFAAAVKQIKSYE